MFQAPEPLGESWTSMLNHLIAVNNLEPVMEKNGLVLREDLFFIEELIFGKKTDPDHPKIEVCTLRVHSH